MTKVFVEQLLALPGSAKYWHANTYFLSDPLALLCSAHFSICATSCSHWEIQCLPYAGLFYRPGVAGMFYK